MVVPRLNPRGYDRAFDVARAIYWSMRGGLILCGLLSACGFHPAGTTRDAGDGDAPGQDATADAWPDAAAPNANGYDKQITVQGNQVAGDVTGFPIWISLANDPDLGAYARDDHSDVYFVDNTGTPIAFEITAWNKSSGTLQAWVRIAHLAPTPGMPNPNELHLRFGGITAPQAFDGTDVFDNNFSAVWHLDGLSGTTVADATATTPGTLSGTATPAPGQLGNGLAFTGTASSVSFTSPITGGGSSTMSAWVDEAPSSAAYSYALIVIGTAATDQARWFYAMHGGHNQSICAGLYSDDDVPSPANILPDTSWKKLDWVYDGNAKRSRLYVDGTEIDSLVLGTASTTSTAGMFANAPAAYQNYGTTAFNGVLDEVRISKSARSANWLRTEYNNQHDPGSFYTVDAATPL